MPTAAPATAVILQPKMSVKTLTMGEQKKIIPMEREPTHAARDESMFFWSHGTGRRPAAELGSLGPKLHFTLGAHKHERRSSSSSEPNSRRRERKRMPKAFWIPNTEPLHHMAASMTTQPQPPSGCTNSTSSAACSGTATLLSPFFISSTSSERFSSTGTSSLPGASLSSGT
ncbi:hypothetical protein EYF80_004458 [Liparis tanakae]|uniref:Uncharacterized protein n=1 Tax=Liparis tanakae TaxID=230148 RepID=A0A4Z2J5H3_9TELE|nr:hypothetical protein EYF80_004458 [Liparis tanakae]